MEKTEPDDTPRCSSPVKINLAEQNIQYNSFAANSGSLLASNCNLSDNSKLKDVESCGKRILNNKLGCKYLFACKLFIL